MDARAHVVPHAKGNLTTAPPCRTSNLATRMLVTFGISKTTMPPSLGRTGDKAPVEEPTKSMLSKVSKSCSSRHEFIFQLLLK